ncbi:MAG: universal stress protein UspA [Planctomycetota bacterium]|nr:MAG: universal stress protein UspA [Planctomycetota bacterium]
MINTVVAAVDGSSMSLVALQYGAEIARRSGAWLRAVFVKDVKLLESGALAEPPARETIEAAVAAEAQEALGRARDLVGRLGMALESDIRRGVVPLVLCEEAAEADLLTMGRWGEHALWSTGLLGSAVECVVRKVGKPVLVASGPYRAPRRVLVAYDGSEHAQHALRLGAHVAGLFRVPLALLHVNPDQEEGMALLAKAERLAHANPPAGGGAPLEVRRLVHEGERAAEIAAEADEHTLTFMGAYGKSPMRELILGSVTAQVMRKARGPVVLCR